MSTGSSSLPLIPPEKGGIDGWALEFGGYAPWLRVSEPLDWVSDGFMVLIEHLNRHAGLANWTLSFAGDRGVRSVEWDGTRTGIRSLFERHRSAGGVFDSIILESSSIPRFSLRVKVGSPVVGVNKVMFHDIGLRVKCDDPIRGAAIAMDTVRGIVRAWDPAFVAIRDIPLIEVDPNRAWRVYRGRITWVSDALGDLSAAGVAEGSPVIAERHESGTLLTVGGELDPEGVAQAVSDVLLRSGIDEVPRDLLQSMEVPSRGVVPESVEVGEGFRPAVSVGEGEYEDPGELYRQQISGWLLNEQGEAPYWVQPEPSTEIPVRYVGHTWRGDTEVFLHAVYGNDRFGDLTDDLAVLSAPRLLSIASWQLSVLPEGGVLEWHASTSSAATGLRNFFAVHGLSQIRVVHTPAVEGKPDE